MLIDIHAHTSRHSPCSSLDPVVLVHQAVKKGLQGLVITEHNYLWSNGEIERLRQEAELDASFLLLSAQEASTDIGHVLVYGAGESIEERMSVGELRKACPHAALVWAHPLRSGKIPRKERLLDQSLDAIEIFNNNHSPRGDYLGLMLWHRYKFTAVSGSDTHGIETAGTLPTLFDHPVATMGELIDEIRRGRCRPLYKEIPRTGSNILVEEIIMGTKGEDESRRRIIVKRPRNPGRWESLRGSSEVLKQVHDHGFSSGTFRVPPVVDIDEKDRFIIEEGQRGKSLFELLPSVGTRAGEEYFLLAARWLARLHGAKVVIGTPERTSQREHQRFDSYLKSFSSTQSPFLEQAIRLVEAVRDFEEGLFSSAQDFVLVHGDYHPKNIIIGQDRMQDIGTLFISVVDFGSALLFHPAFDVGYFISQFMNQFRDYPGVIGSYQAERFIQAYLEASQHADSPGFRRAVKLFEIRASLSIASFLIHLGMGRSEDLEDIMNRSMNLLDEVGRI